MWFAARLKVTALAGICYFIFMSKAVVDIGNICSVPSRRVLTLSADFIQRVDMDCRTKIQSSTLHNIAIMRKLLLSMRHLWWHFDQSIWSVTMDSLHC